LNLLIRTRQNQRRVLTKKARLQNRNQSHETVPRQTPHRRPLILRVCLIHYHFHQTHTTIGNIQCLLVKRTPGFFTVHSSTHNLVARISPTWCYDRPALPVDWLADVRDQRKLAPHCPTTMERRSGLHAGLLSLSSVLSPANGLTPTSGVWPFITTWQRA